MRYLKTFESHSSKDILIVVDVQKSFHDFFTDNYVNELKKYCNEFSKVYQIWDNHHLGKNVDKDYLYDEDPEIPNHDDLYDFPNQVDLIEKRYNYDVDADFYKRVLTPETYEEVKKKEDAKELKRGDFFPTNEGTLIVYVGNNHIWYHLPKKLHELFTEVVEAQDLNENLNDVRDVILVGGADGECLTDIETAAEAMGVKLRLNHKYIYSASHCPIK
jgi:hypothetical protein